MLKRKEISLHNEVKHDISAYIDINTIGIVIRNLLTNAIKFTPIGGVIRITSYSEGDKINIIFSDTGIGIKSENLAYLFDVNNNASSLGTEDEKGTGLGLLLCKEFTELNKGTISAESEFGIGSRFTIRLPYG
jgi:signal transduction histidine kinase